MIPYPTKQMDTKIEKVYAPVPVSVRHPTRLDCDEDGRCWWFYEPVADQHDGCWQFEKDALYRYPRYWPTHWLPANTPFPMP